MIQCRFMKSNEADLVSQLITRVFNQSMAPKYRAIGSTVFYRYIKPAALVSRSLTNHSILVALKKTSLVGMIELRDYHHVALFFVDVKAQGQGIGTTLWQTAFSLCQENSSNLRQITVNASPYAMPFYKRCGFQSIGPRQMHQGIQFTPMALPLQTMTIMQ